MLSSCTVREKETYNDRTLKKEDKDEGGSGGSSGLDDNK